MSEPEPERTERTELRRSSRVPEVLRTRLQAWLVRKLGDESAVVSDVGSTSATGMSSETVLFDAGWTLDGLRQEHRLVARLAPDASDVPVFPSYEMARQFEVIRLVGELSSVPVPRVWWLEPEVEAIGTPFFVMERIDGDVPPDVMPYNFGDSWLFDAGAAEQRRLQDASVALLASLHAIDGAGERFAFLAFDEEGGGDSALRRHVAHARAWYSFAIAGEGTARSPLIERGFAWLDDNWPDDSAESVVSWGDARIGNIMYRDFEPVAVLDWEMAGLGPRELDVAWMVYSHRAFEDIAARYGFPGMPGFLLRDDVVAAYESAAGCRLRDLDWYLGYAAVQWGIVGLRTGLRQVHFGERPMPEDVDELLLNREALEELVAS